jgi:hypothetical protein
MAKEKQKKRRPFNPGALEPHANPVLRPRMGPGETLWRYTTTIPLEEITPKKRQIATPEDVRNLQLMLGKHFGGFSRLPDSFGYGLRDPEKPEEEPELNVNAAFVVLASPVPQAETYFRALRDELETALDEGVILVERQQVWIP